MTRNEPNSTPDPDRGGLRSALLFDLDGTLLHSDPLHIAVFQDIFAERGQAIDRNFYMSRIHGRLNEAIFTDHFPEEDPHLLADRKEAAFRDRLGASVPAMPGISALLSTASAAGIPVAVVTNAPRENAETMLRAIGLHDRFPVVVVGNDHPPGKPDPAPYLAALRQLGADASVSVAFEDSPGGIAAAKGAGLFTVGIRSSLDDAALREAGADISVEDFSDPDLAKALTRIIGIPA